MTTGALVVGGDVIGAGVVGGFVAGGRVVVGGTFTTVVEGAFGTVVVDRAIVVDTPEFLDGIVVMEGT